VNAGYVCGRDREPLAAVTDHVIRRPSVTWPKCEHQLQTRMNSSYSASLKFW